MNLYELKENYLKVLEMIEAGDEAEWLDDTLESINDEIEIKADGYARIIRNLEGNTVALKTEIDRLTNRKKSIENSVDRLKENLKQAMIATKKEKIKIDLFNITVANNPVALKITDESKIADAYISYETIKKIDNAQIKKDLKDGMEFDWAELTQGKGLRIK